MKLIDEKGKLFGKINLFDLLILVLVVVAVIGMATRLIKPGAPTEDLHTATYTVEACRVQECFKDAFQVGDTLYENGVELGTVTEVTVVPAKTVEILPGGTYGTVEHVTTYDIMLTVTTDQLRVKSGFHIGSQEMLAGTSHFIGNGYAKCNGVIRTIDYQ